MEKMIAQQAVERLEEYKRAAEQGGIYKYDTALHNACISALNKQMPKAPRKAKIFEGEEAKKLEAEELPNYETYKCPVCNRIVAERRIFSGFRIFNYCKNCGQALETEITEE